MDELQELTSRVEAARDRLQKSADEDRRYGLRLNDIAAIVEGSLSGYRADIERLRAQLDQVLSESATLRKENDAARVALLQAREIANSLQGRINQRETQNEILRRLLVDLLNVVEGDHRPALADVLRTIEASAKSMIDQARRDLPVAVEPDAQEPATNADAEPESSAPPLAPAAQIATLPVSVRPGAPPAPSKPEPVAEPQVVVLSAAEPEPIGQVALVEAGAIVADPMAEATNRDASSAELAPDIALREAVGAATR
jgi:regulator of replication initiation timing